MKYLTTPQYNALDMVTIVFASVAYERMGFWAAFSTMFVGFMVSRIATPR